MLFSSTRAAMPRNVLQNVIRDAKRRLSSPPSVSPLKSTRSQAPRVIFSGIQPTGIPHLGNYLGALSNWVKLQNEAEPEDILLYSIVGWHALTLPQEPRALSASRLDMMACLLAMGINPDRSIVFHQDDNQDHTELAWILNCVTPMGELSRMTTWKSRLAASQNVNSENVNDYKLNVGLFAYPVLQAADILAYKATHVPVGDDQTQHLELCRGLARHFNHIYGNSQFYFPLPEQMTTAYNRVLSLKDPTSKMSKSSKDPKSTILLTDSESEIRLKVRGAVTDSFSGATYDPKGRPGVSSLLSIFAACTGLEPATLAERYEHATHKVLKDDLAEAINAFLDEPRAEYHMLRQDEDYLRLVARRGAEKAKELSQSTIQSVRRRIGLF